MQCKQVRIGRGKSVNYQMNNRKKKKKKEEKGGKRTKTKGK